MTIIYKEHAKTSIVELNFDGKVTKQDINDVTPRIEAFISAHDKIKLLEIVADDFDGIELSTLIKAIKFDKKHLKNFSHCAVVTDKGWIGPITRLASSVFDIEIKVFTIKNKEDALTWLEEV